MYRFVFLFLVCVWGASAELRLAGIFSDHMVVQQRRIVPVWGWAKPKARVVVRLERNTATTTALEDGSWSVRMPILPGAGPYELLVESDGKTATVKDIVPGEVWICSGQSNMEWNVGGSQNAAEEIKAATHPMIRHIAVTKAISPTPKDDISSGGWQICSPETVGGFTAVGYFFARKLHADLKVPIGLIHTSWGGTVAEAWTSAEALKEMADFKAPVEAIAASTKDLPALQKAYNEAQAKWQSAYDAALKAKMPWEKADLDHSKWKTMKLPTFWESAGLPDLDGLVWFRRTVAIPEVWAGKEATLNLGQIDDQDWTSVNGKEVGSIHGWTTPRSYTIPADQVKAGKMTIAVRVLDTGGGGGLHGSAEQMSLTQKDQPSISLAGDWHYSLSDAMQKVPARPVAPPFTTNPNEPTALYNAMIAPLLKTRIAGAIWYQGESNAGRGEQYETLFPGMITDWRARWKQGDFPFYFVQLANFMAPSATPSDTAWARLRDAQRKTLELPNTGMAVVIDIGEEKDIHPRNKQDVGKRLALQALGKTYERDVVPSGPSFKALKVEGKALHLSFDDIGGGLVVSGEGALKQFAIAGKDKVFHWAEAKIDGESVIVTSPKVAEPVAVRYAWADNPIGCNLANKAGLPASPFRSDDW
ncbi:MAG: sialate O-acetylesterase [Rhodothermales bacterium]|jgi:sialate O-acetylesterase